MTQFEDDAYRVDAKNRGAREQMRKDKNQSSPDKDSGIRLLNGSSEFYQLLGKMQELHDRKSHDYASNSSPFANYQFAGMLSKLFDNPDDAGFLGRIGEKLYRLANLENSGKMAKNETIEDTELDICVITTLWMASRVQRRLDATKIKQINMEEGSWETPSKEEYERRKSEEQCKKIIELLNDIGPADRVAMRGYLNTIIRDDNAHKGS